MHNRDDKDQSLSENSGGGLEPSWVRPVKIASMVMGFLIVAGLVLLVYGLWAGLGDLADGGLSEGVFTYPEDMVLRASSAGADGTLLLEFEASGDDSEGARLLVVLDPHSGEVKSMTKLVSGEAFGFAE